VIVLLVLLCLVLAGCSESNTKNGAETSSAAATETASASSVTATDVASDEVSESVQLPPELGNLPETGVELPDDEWE